MMHETRRHSVKEYSDATELARDLQTKTFTLCTGFRYRGLLLLNDSLSESGAQEYAALMPDGVQMRQVESLTVSWSNDVAKLANTIEMLARGEWGEDLGLVDARKHGDCCALCGRR